MKTSKVFLDTNFLFYLYSAQDLEKQKKALNWIEINKTSHYYISIQVQKELYVALTSKLKMDKLEVRQIIQKTNKLNIVINTADQVERAMELNILHSFSFYDALIYAAAEFVGCDKLLTEDMQNGLTLSNLEVVNPFL